MKALNTILALMMAAGTASAQAPATSKPKAPASQTVAGEQAPAPKKAASPMTPKKPMAAPATKKAPAAATATAKPAAKPAAKPTAAKKPAGKRDPFMSPVVRTSGGGPGAVCATGKRCLVIGEVVLKGVVKTQSGMIAVVSNQANRTYFLRDNDPVFNGMVLRITGDSVVFRENVVDNLGRETTREVVKRVSAPVV